MVKPSVLVTRRWPAAVEARLAETYDATFNIADVPMATLDMRDAMRRYDAVLPTVTDKLGADVFEITKPQAKIIGNYGVGYSHICEASARSSGMTVTNTPDVLSECTADIAMTLMLMVARRAGEGEREVREGRWTGWRPTHLVGTKVSGKTLGIIGFGRIGQKARLEVGIDPGPRHHLRPAHRTDMFRIGLDPCIDSLGCDQSFFNGKAFQRLHPERRIAW